MTRQTPARATNTMIPESLDLPPEAEWKIEAIDARLDEIDEESQKLLEHRSQIIEDYS